MGVTYKISAKNIYLDANIFIYALEGYAEFISILGQLFDLMDNDNLYGITSELSLAETLVKPMADKNMELQQAYKKAIQTSEALQVAPISREILIAAARLRSDSLRLPDAIHMATAQANNCQIFLTNDKRLKNISDVKVLLISEIKDSRLVLE